METEIAKQIIERTVLSWSESAAIVGSVWAIACTIITYWNNKTSWMELNEKIEKNRADTAQRNLDAAKYGEDQC